MRDYRGFGKATRPMLPSIGVPTTAGTGSEAQSYCIISDAETHAKMACGDPKAAFHVAILDPALTVTLPASVTRHRRVRRALARGRGLRDDEANRRVGALRARRLAAARVEFRAGAAGAGRSRGARGDVGRRAPGRDGDRAVDARRDACVRQPADGALRHRARRRHRRHAAARGALERAVRRRPVRRAPQCLERGQTRMRTVFGVRRRMWTGSRWTAGAPWRTARRARASRRTAANARRDRRRPKPTCRPWLPTRPRNGREISTRVPSMPRRRCFCTRTHGEGIRLKA